MLNATTGGCNMPRQIFKWLDSLDLSFSVRNPRIDLANGFIVAQILSRYFPQEVSIYTYYNAQAKDKRHNNWQQIQKVMLKKEFKIEKEEYEGISNLGPDQAQNLLYRLYEFLTKKKLHMDKRTMMPEDEAMPLYSKPTASYMAKDRELARIVNKDVLENKTKNIITNHLKAIKNQKYNSGLIEWLITKRKLQIQQEVARQHEQMTRRTKTLNHNTTMDNKGEIKEIQLKCFNSSTSKKAKGNQGDFMEAKGIVDFLMDSCIFLLKKDVVSKDIKKLGLQLKEKDNGDMNILAEMFRRFGETDQNGERKIQSSTLQLLINHLNQPAEIGLVIENVYNNFIDFKKYFGLFLKPLAALKTEEPIFNSIVELLTTISEKLLEQEPENTHLMFRSLLLKDLLDIGNKDVCKRYPVAQICMMFTKCHTVYQYETIMKVKEHLGQDTKLYLSYLSCFIQIILKSNGQLEQSLWNEMYFYAMNSLTNPSPIARTHGCKIISELVVFDENIFLDKLDILKRLIKDSWWEVRAQTLIVFSRILISKKKNKTIDHTHQAPRKSLNESALSSRGNAVDEELNLKTTLNCIHQIFKNGVTHNILRIGLIELAELLNYEEDLCERYLEVLLNIGEEIRVDVLNTAQVKVGPVVFGSNTFSYRLTGAPLEWNSIGIAKALDANIRNARIQYIQKEHLDILYSALARSHEAQDKQVWLEVYTNLKQYIYRALADPSLCKLASEILKMIFTIQDIQKSVMKISKDDFKSFLNTLCVGEDMDTKQNMLELFQYFNTLSEDFRQYTYQILKEFSEEEKEKYLASNFVDFMNELARKRRSKIFHEA